MQVRTVVMSVDVANMKVSILRERAFDPIVPIPILNQPSVRRVPFLQDLFHSYEQFFLRQNAGCAWISMSMRLCDRIEDKPIFHHPLSICCPVILVTWYGLLSVMEHSAPVSIHYFFNLFGRIQLVNPHINKFFPFHRHSRIKNEMHRTRQDNRWKILLDKILRSHI